MVGWYDGVAEILLAETKPDWAPLNPRDVPLMELVTLPLISTGEAVMAVGIVFAEVAWLLPKSFPDWKPRFGVFPTCEDVRVVVIDGKVPIE